MSGAQQKPPFGLRSRWIKYVNPSELEQLATLERRIRLKEASLAALKAERHTIMRRCIRRAQRTAD